MEKRIEKLEEHFGEMQKSLYEVVAIVKAINNHITKAINMEEKVIRLDERQKVNEIRLSKCEANREKMKADFYTEIEGMKKDFHTEINEIKKNNNATNLKLAMYSGGIIIISLFVPYIFNSLMK